MFWKPLAGEFWEHGREDMTFIGQNSTETCQLGLIQVKTPSELEKRKSFTGMMVQKPDSAELGGSER